MHTDVGIHLPGDTYTTTRTHLYTEKNWFRTKNVQIQNMKFRIPVINPITMAATRTATGET